MKTPAKIALSLLALSLTGFVAHTALAQFHGGGERGPRGPEHRAQMQKQHAMMGHMMAEYLGLDAEQRGKMKALHEAQQSALKALHADSALTMPQRREEARAIHQSYQQQREALLTPDQQARAAELRAKVKQRVKHRMQQHAGQIAQQETQQVLREFMQARHRAGPGKPADPK